MAEQHGLALPDVEVDYLKDHYVNYPCVLARLGKIHPDALRDLVGMAWAYMNAKAPRRRTVKAKAKKKRKSR